MQNKKRWLFITAGLGSENFQDAALRLVKQAESFEVFDHCHAVLNDEILDISRGRKKLIIESAWE